MQGASRDALARLHDALPAEGDLQQLSGELFAVVTLLSDQASLRRALSDPSGGAEAKVAIVDRLLGERLGSLALDLVREAVRQRWSQPRDLVDALEELAVSAQLAVAEQADQLGEVEDELFRFGQILKGSPELRAALTDRNLPAERKSQLLHRLLDGRTTAVTLALLERAILEPRGRTLERAIVDLSTLAARRREQLLARVTSAVELTEAEQTQLAASLKQAFGHDVRLQVVVDESLIGGLTVRIGDELIDGSVARQLEEARRRLTGRSTRRTT
ncbi:MAG TPA: F0F1 ATP synthase subunit delta [Mycobacteriales bacterium]|jgi:F-type H+-transporting ATPase subunit delta|nr:F0F1 ATP synthase subunit delta [Mycobacteriales bacterium]